MLALEKTLPERHWVAINAQPVPFGKHICTGICPTCSTCSVREMCQQVGVTSHRSATAPRRLRLWWMSDEAREIDRAQGAGGLSPPVPCARPMDDCFVGPLCLKVSGCLAPGRHVAA